MPGKVPTITQGRPGRHGFAQDAEGEGRLPLLME